MHQKYGKYCRVLAGKADERNENMKYVFDDTPMSIRLKQAREARRKWPTEKRVDSLIEIGAIKEAEREEAVANMKRAELRKQKAQRKKTAAKKSA